MLRDQTPAVVYVLAVLFVKAQQVSAINDKESSASPYQTVNDRRHLLPVRESNSWFPVRSARNVTSIRSVDHDIDSSTDSATEDG